MQQNFEYRIDNNKITITKYIGSSTIVKVPENIDEIEVSRIGEYAFSECRNITEVILPKSVTSIGSHAFYNCRKLKALTVSDHIHTMEDGSLKNCEMLSCITLYMIEGRTTCMKDILAETNGEMFFTLFYSSEEEDNSCSKLVFPSYLHDYVENTEARIINQVTYGAGVHYRECMNEKDVDYKRYDDLFRYVMANDTKDTACYIAINRLSYPFKLSKEAKEQYYSYLQNELTFIVRKLLKEDDITNLEQLANLDLFTENNIDDMIELAHSVNRIEATNFFMQYKKLKFNNIEKTFEL